MINYTITTRTAHNRADQNMAISLIGGGRQTPLITLNNPKKNDFESGATDVFEVRAVKVGHVSEIQILYEPGAASSDWTFEWVKVVKHGGGKDEAESIFTNGSFSGQTGTQSGPFHIYSKGHPTQQMVTMHETKKSNVSDILKKALSGRLHPNIKFHLADAQYYFPSMERVKEILAKSKAETSVWTPEVYDCDDFAVALKHAFVSAARTEKMLPCAHASGMLWGALHSGGGHAINWVITGDHQLHFIEPQSDVIFSPDSEKGKDFHDIHFIMA